MTGGNKALPTAPAGALLFSPTNTPNMITIGRRRSISKQIHFRVLLLGDSGVGSARAVVSSVSLPSAESSG